MNMLGNSAIWRGAALAALVGAGALASAAPTAAIFTCTDAKGRKHTSDRFIVECNGLEQRVLNSDGSLRQVIEPAMSGDERAARDTREREAAAQRAAQQEAVRRDRNLAARYPNEAAHAKARESALEGVRKSVRNLEKRIATLTAERKPLMAEAEFYAGKPMPAKLKQQIDANDVTAEAQRALVQNQQAEEGRVNALYDNELERLRKLWAGVAPGSMGPLMPPASAVAAAAPSTANAK